MTSFKTWNNIIKNLTYNHNMFEVFQDYLNIIIDGYTIPNQKPLFQHKDRYTPEEQKIFIELFHEQLKIMEKELQNKKTYDFLGEWWESDQNLTNKGTEQYFTPQDICTVMSELTLGMKPVLDDNSKVMHDCCCGTGRFALSHHQFRPQDWYFLVDIDETATKMCILNMLLHGMRGVVVHGNALTREVFQCWQITPSLFEYSGLQYVVPCGTDLKQAVGCLPSEKLDFVLKDKEKQNKMSGTLDDWF
jgi:type I restriction-modification system DNA methylase subunit